MIDDTTGQEPAARPLRSSFDRYLQDKGKGRGGDGGNYRRNASRELERFAEWAAGDRADDGWTGITPEGADRAPAFADLDEWVFREYARHLAGDRGLKQNTVQTYYAYVSAWCGWCVNEGYLEAHYAQRASATAPLPDDDLAFTVERNENDVCLVVDDRSVGTATVDSQVTVSVTDTLSTLVVPDA